VSARPPRHTRARSGRSHRTRWFVGSVLAVAAVIVVLGAFSRPAPAAPSSRTAGSIEATRAPGQAAYEAGLRSLASGETTSAVALFEAAAAAGNAAAKAKLAETANAAKPSAPASVPPDTAYFTKVDDPATLLPTALSGYTVSSVERSAFGAIVALQPTAEGPAGKVTLVVLTTLDKKTEAGARSYVNGITKAFPKNLATVTVGSRAGRFGTDGARLASVVFSRGRYAFEVVATAYRVAPLEVKDVVVAAAASFPAAH
jgi:hypothetical protein